MSNLERILQPLEALFGLRERHAKAFMLLPVPGRADAEIRPPTGEHVERRHRLDEEARIAIGYASHKRAELDTAGAPGGEPQCRIRFEHLVFGGAKIADLVKVIHHPETVETGLFSALGDRAKLLAQSRLPARPCEVIDLQSDSHSASAFLCYNLVCANSVTRRAA